MSVHTKPAARPARTTATAVLTRLRLGSLAILVLTVVEYGIGMYVNLYVTLPGADHGGSLGTTISNGPAVLSLHAAVGLLLGLGALGVLVQSIMARQWAVVTASAVGLLALAFASVAGTGASTTGDTSASMAMAMLTGVALLCYVANLSLLPRPADPGNPGKRPA